MSDQEDDPKPHEAAESPLMLPLGGHALADLILERAMRGHFQAKADALAAENEQLRKPTAREVIERYNRRHSHDPKITLKQVCKEMNVNYASIRALKSRYAKQKRGKRS